MRRYGSHLLALILVGVSLTACADAPPPQPTSSASPTTTPSASPTPSATSTPSATPSSTPTPSTPPASNPPPQQVTGLTAQTGGGSGEVLLRWTQNDESDIAYYEVLKATSPGGPRTQIGRVTPEEVTQFEVVPFVDSQAGVAYYRVRAVDSAGQEGPKSAEVCGAAPGFSC